MNKPALAHIQSERLQLAERQGLRLAIVCRTLVIAAGLVWVVVSSIWIERAPSWLAVATLVGFIAIGVLNLAVIGTRHDRWWLKWVISALDILGVCAILVVMPLGATAEVPQILAFRVYGIYLLFPLVVLAALSLSWRLVVWAGLVAVAGWWSAFLLIVADMPRTVSWGDLLPGAPQGAYEAVLLAPDFIGRGNRVVETGCLLAAALILALVVHRARAVFLAQVAAEAEREHERQKREKVASVLGRYVPEAIARRLMEDDRALEPHERHAVALVADIAGFTAYAANRAPTEVIAGLNGFLARAAAAVSERDGVVIVFTGDGLLATFNTPIETREPERAAFEVAGRLVAIAAEAGFGLRVGLAAGPIVSGSVGSADRQAFTVYGDTVNRASRLEGLAKELGEVVVLDDRVAATLAGSAALRRCGPRKVSGYAEPLAVFAAVPAPT